MKKKFKIAIIGCGLISKNHFLALQNIPIAKCIAVCDIDLSKAQEAATKHGISRVYTDYREMLKKEDIDVVHICTPHYLHAQMTIDCFEYGKHVLCEKPMALTVEDAKKMIAARDKAGKQLAVCFQNRYNESSIYMKRFLQKNCLGKLIGARAQVTWNRKPEYYTTSTWRGKWATEGGGVLINQAIHTFDLLQWLTCEIKSVEATMSTKRLKESIEVEDTIDVLMTGKNSERLLFYASNCYVINAPVEIEVICEKGSLKLVGNKVTTIQGNYEEVNDFSSGTVYGKDYWGSGHGFLIEDFYKSLYTNTLFQISGEEAITSVKLLEAVYSSAKNNQVRSIV